MTWVNGEYIAKQQRADEKKNCILDAALKLFGSKGYYKTNTKMIAAEAGVATGTFYRYFKDKKAVLMAVCYRMEEELGEKLFEKAVKMREDGVSEKIIVSELIRNTLKSHSADKDFHKEMLALRLLDEDISKLTDMREKRIYEIILEFIKGKPDEYAPKDTEAAAELIYYIIEEAAHRSVILQPYTTAGRVESELESMLLSYLFK